MDVAWSRNRVGRGAAFAAFAAAALGAGNDLHGWYYVGAAVFYTVGIPTFFYYLATRQDRPQ